LIERVNVRPPGIRRRPTSPELLAVAVRQVHQATREMSQFGVANAIAELAGVGLF
jgi:hypothetical protein